VFILLLGAAIVTGVIDRRRGAKSFRGTLLKYETAKIDRILLSKPVTNENIELQKADGIWTMLEGDRKLPADQRIANTIVDYLNELVPDGVISSRKERWSEFEVSDSLAIHVQLLEGAKKTADFYIGRYVQAPGVGKTYLRKSGDNTIYRLSSTIGMEVNRNKDGFRNKTVIKCPTKKLQKLSFTYPADSSFVLEKQDTRWLLDGQPADSAKVASFINAFSLMYHYQYASDKPDKEPDYIMLADTAGIPVEIKGYIMPDDRLVVTSSQNEGSCFESTPVLRNKLFPSPSRFKK
jgi:hypothetical protein